MSCGHVFHLECLTQKLKKSKICPYYHEKTTKIQRIQCIRSNNFVEDTSVQQKVNEPMVKVKLQEEELISKLKKKYKSKAKKRADELRMELEHEINNGVHNALEIGRLEKYIESWIYVCRAR